LPYRPGSARFFTGLVLSWIGVILILLVVKDPRRADAV
jgi:hypothetical protein